MQAEVRLDRSRLLGGLYLLREGSRPDMLFSWPRRLQFGEHHITTDRSNNPYSPKLHIKVNPDWSLTVDTIHTEPRLGTIIFPVLRSRRTDILRVGSDSPFTDVTISPIENEDLIVLMNQRNNTSRATRIIYVAPPCTAGSLS